MPDAEGSGSEQSDRVIPDADCPGCDDSTVLEAPEAGYAMCADCGERGYRRGDTVDWWRNDPDSWWYVEDEDDGLRADGGVPYDETQARQKRREERFKCRAGTVARGAKRELKGRITDLRGEERLARKRHHDDHAEQYREAANALESALAEVEGYLGGEPDAE